MESSVISSSSVTLKERSPASSTGQPNIIYPGYILLGISFLVFAWTDGHHHTSNEDMLVRLFFIHYLLAFAYAGYLLFKKSLGVRKSWKAEHIHATMIVLNLFLISAYALNRVIPVFQRSAPWLCAFLILSSAVVLTYRFFTRLPAAINRLQHIILGSAIVFYAYQALYVTSYYIFGFVGTLALGIGAHIFLPLFLLAGATSLIRFAARSRRVSVNWVTVGAVFSVVFVLAFVVEWNARISRIETLSNQSVILHDQQVPAWVSLARDLENDWIGDRILKSDLVYSTAPESLSDWELFPARTRWHEMRLHDPLVFLASMTARPTLSEEEKVNILTAISGSRHRREERLWSGNDLSTSYIISDVDIYAGLRLAYTEKYFTIRNNAPSRGSFDPPQEALYTFQLPQGSVVTSLSLWIEGKEQQAVLTSRGHATTAYKTIVGVEQRDPSVVHWQEGHTVTVRVFPCTRAEERRFKIGITSPLPVVNGKILYSAIRFAGPDASEATHTMRIRINGTSQPVTLAYPFRENQRGEYLLEEPYDPDFHLSFPVVPMPHHAFTFENFTYSLAEYEPAWEQASIRDVYVDLNRTWTDAQKAHIESVLESYRVFAFHNGEFVRLTRENFRKMTSQLSERNFSLFPFHLLPDPAASLVITCGDVFTPHIGDFSDSEFARRMRELFKSGHTVRVFNFRGGISTYVNSLREFRAIRFVRGGPETLKKILNEKVFPRYPEDDSTVLLHDASMLVHRTPASRMAAGNSAPDHLARLFVYNNIMRRIGPDYFSGEYDQEALAREASSAYVVSPVSSLIVLESQKDYDRFDIRDQGNSLYNASRESSGAVPEPEEWALMVLFVLFVIYVKYRN